MQIYSLVPGLTKVMNCDDWRKVFLACSELPDYRDTKYSSYFLTKDSHIRSGKLYYYKEALKSGGYQYVVCSHKALQLADTNINGTFEFAGYTLASRLSVISSGTTTTKIIIGDLKYEDKTAYYYFNNEGVLIEKTDIPEDSKAITVAQLEAMNGRLYKRAVVSETKDTKITIGPTYFLIDFKKGALTTMVNTTAGENLSSYIFVNTTDETYKRGVTYYRKTPVLGAPVGSSYNFLPDPQQRVGELIPDRLDVFVINEQVYVANDDVVGNLTHDGEYYERAGSRFPYEGFLAIATESGGEQTRGGLYRCKQKQFVLSEDTIRNWGKSYYEYHADTGEYIERKGGVEANDRIYRPTSGSTFVQHTGDTVFVADRVYYTDEMGSTKVTLGKLVPTEAGELYLKETKYYIADGEYYKEDPNVRIGDKCGTGVLRLTDDVITLGNFVDVSGGTYKENESYFLKMDDGTYHKMTDITPGQTIGANVYQTTSKPIAAIGCYVAETEKSAGVEIGDTNRRFYWRRINEMHQETWDFTDPLEADPANGVLYGLTTDTKFDRGKMYYFYSGNSYNWVAIPSDKRFTTVTDDVFCFKTLTDEFYGYRKLVPGVDFQIGDDIPANTVFHPNSRGDAIDTHNPYTGTYGLGGEYHVRRKLSEVPDVGESFYCIYDATAGRVTENKLTIAEGQIGKRISEGVVYKWEPPEHTYFYMFNMNADVWESKFKPFELTSGLDDDPAQATPVAAGTVTHWYRTYGMLRDDGKLEEVKFEDGELIPEEGQYYIITHFANDYSGRKINSQAETIYWDNADGLIPTALEICVPFHATNENKDGWTIPNSPQLYLSALEGEAILSDEYYEYVQGLFFWEQFFIDQDISSTSVYNIDAMFTNEKLLLNWKDPELMTKKDDPMAAPDAWYRTTLDYYSEGTGTIRLLSSTSHSAYAIDPLEIKLGTAIEESGVIVTTAMLENGYLQLTAVSQTGMVAQAPMFKAKQLVLDNDAVPTYYPLYGNSKALPGVRYYNQDTGEEIIGLEPWISTVADYVVKFQDDLPVYKRRNDGIYLPVELADTTVEAGTHVGDTVSKSGDYYVLLTSSADKISLCELIKSGKAIRRFDIGDEITLPIVGKFEAVVDPETGTPTGDYVGKSNTTDGTACTVVDFNHAKLKRDYESMYVEATEEEAIPGVKYYAKWKPAIYEVWGNQPAFDFCEVTNFVPPTSDFCLYRRDPDRPHYQYYKRNTGSGSEPFVKLAYTGDTDWLSAIWNNDVELFFHDVSKSTMEVTSMVPFVTSEFNVTLRTPKFFDELTSVKLGSEDLSWFNSTVHNWFESSAANGFTSLFGTADKDCCGYRRTDDELIQWFVDNCVATVVTPVASRNADASSVTISHSLDKFWIPSASQAGVVALFKRNDSAPLPVVNEGARLDWFNPDRDPSVHVRKTLWPLCIPSETAATKWWLRSIPDNTALGVGQLVTENGTNRAQNADETADVYAYFTIA